MIYFVGAGPGAPDLITVRGKELLCRADLIIYAGSLVNPALLECAKPDCVILNSASMTLEEVIERMVRGESQKMTTLRLHTGDPSLFGAIREQMDRLDGLGIAYAVVPGVSSLFAAAAALNAEFTIPGVSQSLIITRAAGRTEVPEGEDIADLAAHGASMAVFLSAGLAAALREKLIAGGCGPDTPAAVVYRASWPEEKVIRGTVGELDKMIADNGIEKTALFLIGDFLGEGGAGGRGARSRLYDPAFSHGYREARI
jgi:precorrin-4/cobalt-precorrin-4 C11-methyltransferase